MARVGSSFRLEGEPAQNGGLGAVPLFGPSSNDPMTETAAFAAPRAAGNWRAAIADACTRLAASERRTFEALDRLARRVDALEQDVAALHKCDDVQIRIFEKRIVELSDRLLPLEERIAHLRPRR
jgi:hypothetical protein